MYIVHGKIVREGERKKEYETEVKRFLSVCNLYLESVAATGGQKSNQSDVGVLKENFHFKRNKRETFFKIAQL